MRSSLRFAACSAALSMLSLLTFPAISTAQVRALGLQEIVQSAASSFIGTVTNVRYAYDENRDIVTYTTFRVEEQVTGTSPRTVTIKQLGGIMDGLDTRLQHIRYFAKNERVLVSIYPNSSLGFSNPVGLDQGVWRVTKANQVLDVTPRQLQGLEKALVRSGISAQAANAPATHPITKQSFISLMRSVAAMPKGGAEQ